MNTPKKVRSFTVIKNISGPFHLGDHASVSYRAGIVYYTSGLIQKILFWFSFNIFISTIRKSIRCDDNTKKGKIEVIQDGSQRGFDTFFILSSYGVKFMREKEIRFPQKYSFSFRMSPFVVTLKNRHFKIHSKLFTQ